MKVFEFAVLLLAATLASAERVPRYRKIARKPYDVYRNRYAKSPRVVTRATTLTASSGTFTSPGYSNSYDSNERLVWKIKAGGPVEITCQDFELQKENNSGKCKDFFLIKDTVKTKFCGTNGPINYVSTKSVIKVIFKSNKKKNYSGFSCTYALDDSSSSVTGIVKSALDSYEAGTCGSTPSNTCSCSGITSADSEEGETTSGNYRIVATNGIPDHVYETGQQVANPNSACKHEVYIAVPINPVKGTTYTSYGLGPVGIAFSGGFFYNHLSDPMGSIAVVQEQESFDTCNGHSDPSCRYHYHMAPICMYSGANCTHVGYMMDGFSVYSFCSNPGNPSQSLKSCYYPNSGLTEWTNQAHYTYNEAAYANGDCQLDMANGYTFSDDRGYAYIFTEDYPFIMAGYYGTEKANLCYI